MYVIIVYDIQVDRINQVRKTLRKHLFRVQNSVFEGSIDDATMKRLLAELKALIDESYDSIFIYSLKSSRSLKRTILGIELSPTSFTI